MESVLRRRRVRCLQSGLLMMADRSSAVIGQPSRSQRMTKIHLPAHLRHFPRPSNAVQRPGAHLSEGSGGMSPKPRVPTLRCRSACADAPAFLSCTAHPTQLRQLRRRGGRGCGAGAGVGAEEVVRVLGSNRRVDRPNVWLWLWRMRATSRVGCSEVRPQVRLVALKGEPLGAS